MDEIKKKYLVGMYGGSFNPLHNGHIKCIRKALSLCNELHIIIGDIPNMDDVAIETKLFWFEKIFDNKKESLFFHALTDNRFTKSEYTIEKWILDSEKIKKMIGKPLDIVFCGSDYEKRNPNPYKICYPEQNIIYFDRDDNISSSEFKKDPIGHKTWVPEIVFQYYKKES